MMSIKNLKYQNLNKLNRGMHEGVFDVLQEYVFYLLLHTEPAQRRDKLHSQKFCRRFQPFVRVNDLVGLTNFLIGLTLIFG